MQERDETATQGARVTFAPIYIQSLALGRGDPAALELTGEFDDQVDSANDDAQS